MKRGVVDSGVAIGWIIRRHRSLARLNELFDSCRAGKSRLMVSLVNLVEVIRHTAQATRETGHDPVALLRGQGVELHVPNEAIVRRVARLSTSLADGFAAATALELGARLHTTDRELVAQLRSTRITATLY
ncbi:MAG: PIN domain-containing protein [Myxococcales bacterium]|nr:PIN domain-containing protein [Myxococcales bacterium]